MKMMETDRFDGSDTGVSARLTSPSPGAIPLRLAWPLYALQSALDTCLGSRPRQASTKSHET